MTYTRYMQQLRAAGYTGPSLPTGVTNESLRASINAAISTALHRFMRISCRTFYAGSVRRTTTGRPDRDGGGFPRAPECVPWCLRRVRNRQLLRPGDDLN